MVNWFFKKKKFFNSDQLSFLKQAIADAETQTSGEIRLFIEGSCKGGNSLDRVKHLFTKHKMFNTKQRNGILIYVAFKNKQIAIWGDEGINAKIEHNFWQANIDLCIDKFKKEDYISGLTKLIFSVGESLKKYFPFNRQMDVNELSDEILVDKL